MHPGDRPPSETGYHSTYEAGDLAGLRARGARGRLPQALPQARALVRARRERDPGLHPGVSN
ncbi:hypothetical protein [Nocardioides sp. B-3]|uniref:hypothetical protein n=1 Tax=Nocardioides sp. B-3 TaxID=2895565 RepID=UPI00215211CF|nr:hypothetical protein [Nocardioides sp. B-3]UUZ61069.1 hypothetical protein LP418_10645 [Nocardioides sp. B-3]